MSELKTPVLIYGLGKSGKAAIRLLKNTGVRPNELFLVDEQSTVAESDGIPISKKLDPKINFGTIVVSPGVSLAKPEIREVLKQGARLESEISLAVRHLGGEKTVGVTGSMGKSTTSALIHRGINAAGQDAFLGGNFGIPLADYVCDVLEKKRARAKYLVLELSSYQLENAGDLKLEVSAVVSLAANHLERYESQAHYYDAKLEIIRRTRKSVIFGSRSPDLADIFEDSDRIKKFFGKDRPAILKCDSPQNEKRLAAIPGSPKLPGEHNYDNLLIAAQVLVELGLEKGLSALFTFEGLAHRLENLGTLKGIEAFNDSKATSITSVHRAIETLREARPGKKIHCLVGGRDKKLPWKTLGEFPGRESVIFYFFGECAGLAHRDSGLEGREFSKLGPALEDCVSHARSGEIILLSPGGTSLDEFGNFEKRGDYFRIRIKELLGN
jgi:UDP-N-acetylmuramoylalanine--D-glutamate ligase